MSDERPDAPKDPAKMDRRSSTDRRSGDRRQEKREVEVDRRETPERRKAVRRKRSMNQYDLEADTLEFINAINAFKAQVGRPFPTWSEVLKILRDLGYEKS
jgi:hypothetical protein